MNITAEVKELLELAAQGCINTYQGDHGKVNYDIYQDCISFDTGNVEFDIAIWNDYVIIAFEGSDGKNDWKHNFKFMKTVPDFVQMGKGVKIHRGFDAEYKEACYIIHNELIKEKYKDFEKILVTGHSLGGALATLCAVDLAITYPYCEVVMISEGAPRVGNLRFKKFYHEVVFESIRVVNDLDTVCKAPPSWMFYKHVGKKLIVGKRSWWEYPLHPILWVTGNPLDHYPEDYQKNILALKVS